MLHTILVFIFSACGKAAPTYFSSRIHYISKLKPADIECTDGKMK